MSDPYWQKHIWRNSVTWTLQDENRPVLKEQKNGLWKSKGDTVIRLWYRVKKG